jgi:SAM-dependent methyltransferase
MSKKEKEFEIYNDFEETHWWFRARRNILSEFLTLVEKKDQKSILDIGCGTGGNLKLLFSEFLEIKGVDFDKKALLYASEKLAGNACLIQGDANSLPVLSDSVNCVALLDVLDHQNIDVEKVLSNAHRVLKEDGYLLISDGAFNFLQGVHNKNVGAARRFTKQGIISSLKKQKFDIIKISYWGVTLFGILFIKRFIFEKFPLFKNKTDTKQFDIVSIPVIDHILFYMVTVEKYILKRFSIPIGASIALLAKKK